MTSNEMFGGAKWIESVPLVDAPVFRQEFSAKKGENSVITICGLGFFRLYINGKKVSDDLLVPNVSAYGPLDTAHFSYPLYDETSYRIYVMRYDITDFISDGINTLAVMLGTGYYHQYVRTAEGVVDYGTNKLCFRIEKASGEVLSGKETLCNSGFVTFCNLYEGEKHDYSLLPKGFMLNGFSGDGFRQSKEIEAPDVNFYLQTAPSDKVIRSITEITLVSEENGIKLYDAGENTAGYAVIKCNRSGEKVRVSYAEEIERKDVYVLDFDNIKQVDEFVTDGEDRAYIPLFCWHGFRYFKIEGDAVPVRIDVVHSDCPVTSSFDCDNPQLNWFYKTYITTQLLNMHCAIPSDCPHRERLGYTGDGQLCCEAAMLSLDCREFYRKWLYDIADCQCKKSGHIQHTAPLMGGGGGPSGWGGAIVEVPYKFWKMYGDVDLLNEFFPKMLHYLDYMHNHSENGLVWREEDGGWCLGDWCTPDSIKIPETYVNTCLYVGFMQRVVEIAAILGRENEAAHLADRISASKHAIEVAYYSPQQRAFCGDIQGASCLAMNIGMGNERVAGKITEKYTKLKMFDTGIIATEQLIYYLFKNGEDQLAFDLIAGTGDVSFDYMHRNGATTIWENWNGESSRNHPMFGAIEKYLFIYLLGISQPTDSAGFEKVTVSPRFVSGLNRVSGSIETVRGKISVSYVRQGSGVTVKVYADERIKARFNCGGIDLPFSGEAEFSSEI